MKKYLEPNEVHVLYGISEKTLANWRSQGRRPKGDTVVPACLEQGLNQWRAGDEKG